MSIQALSRWLIGVAALMALVAIGFEYQALRYQDEEQQVHAMQAEFVRLGQAFADAADRLSEEIRRYTVYGEEQHYEAYWHERTITRTQDKVVERLRAQGAMGYELELVETARAQATQLARIEQRAMEAVREGRLDLARELVFGHEYDQIKNAVMQPIYAFQSKVARHTAIDAEAAEHKVILFNWLAFGLTILTMLTMLGILALYFRRRVVRPLVDLSQSLQSLTAGNLDVTIGHGQSCNEIGQLSRALEAFRQQSRTLVRTEAALREREQYFRAVFDNASVGIASLDAHGRFLAANAAFLDFLGYPHEALPHLVPQRITHPDELPETLDLFTRLTNGTLGHVQAERRFRHRDGHYRWGDMRSTAIRDDEGRFLSTVTIVADTTERKQAEIALKEARDAANAANRLKSDFLANMSHEIRTPMNAILGMAYLALKTDLTARQRDYVVKIQGAAQALLGIINDILDFSKIEAGKLDIEATEFDLDAVMTNLATLVGQKAHDKHLELLIAVAPDVPRGLIGDPLRLGQVLINLAGNAVKFTEQGEVMVSVSVQEQHERQITLKFTVRDTGIGLTSEQIGRLFQAFVQADGSTTRKYGGTGLGLTICKRLVGLMDGDIWVESAPGQGSRFHFTARFALGTARSLAPPRLKADLKGRRALVVDDNDTAREILSTMLEMQGLTVTAVPSAEAALAELARADCDTPYHLLFLDWHLPGGLDGMTAAARLRDDISLHNAPKVVLVTAHGRDLPRHEVSTAGIDAVLDKPVSESSLVDVLMSLWGLESGDDSPVLSRTLHNNEAGWRFTGGRVLLAEDNTINQQIAAEILTAAGLEVDVVDNGQQAVSRLLETASPPLYDVVLMDLQMPEMDGFTATRIIRADPRYLQIPIVAMTAHAMAGERERCLAAGMDDHIAKPIDPPAMFATLSRWLTPHPDGGVLKTSTGGLVSELPDLPGIDTADGLRRVGDNRKLYLFLLDRFVEQQGDASTAIRDALAVGDESTAERIAHTVKGVAGNLGAHVLHTAATRLEAAIRDHDHTAIAAALPAFATELETTIAAIAAYRPALPEDLVTATTPEAAEVATSRLRSLLAADDGEALDAFQELRPTLSACMNPADLDRLERSIHAFNFAAALEVLQPSR